MRKHVFLLVGATFLLLQTGYAQGISNLNHSDYAEIGLVTSQQNEFVDAELVKVAAGSDISDISADFDNQSRTSISFLRRFSTTGGGQISAVSDGTHIYTSDWSGGSGTMYKYDMYGTAIGSSFTISDVTQIRDMTYDGTFFYGVNYSTSPGNIFKMDLNAGTLIATISVNVPAIGYLRHISYSPDLDGGNGGFWIGGDNTITSVKMNGDQLSPLFTTSYFTIMGTGYDPHSNPGQPSLFFSAQAPDGSGQAFLHQFDCNTQTITNFMYNLSNDHSGTIYAPAGGMNSFYDEWLFRIVVNVQTSPNTILIYDVANTAPNGVPGRITNLTVTPGAQGALTATLSWTNPNLTNGGTTLTQLSGVEIYQNNVLIHTLPNPPIGGQSSYTANVSESGRYTYKVVPINSVGPGFSTSFTSNWIGHDVPAVPRNANLIIEDNETSFQANVTWQPPLNGLNGGYYTAQNLVYDVHRMPGEILVSNGQTAMSFSETLTTQDTYFYRITARNHIGTGGATNTNEATACRQIKEFMWMEQFSEPVMPPRCWERVTVTGSMEWVLGHAVSSWSPPYSASHGYANGEQDSWLISPEIFLGEGADYVLEYRFRIMGEELANNEVWVLDAQEPGAGTMIKRIVAGDYQMMQWGLLTLSLNDYKGQSFYIGFRYHNPNPYGLTYNTINIDDVSIRDIPTQEAEVKNIYGSINPMVQQPFNYLVAIENSGSMELSDYTVNLKDENDNILVSTSDVPTIQPRTQELVHFPVWIPQDEDEGEMNLFVEVILEDSDEIAISSAYPISIQPYSENFICKIGRYDYEQLTAFIPWSFRQPYSASQTIYHNHDLVDRGGIITHIEYYNYFNMTNEIIEPVEILMANTTLNSLGAWVPFSDLTSVFQGVVEFPLGHNVIRIELDVPFVYSGENLVVMARHPEAIPRYPGSRWFEASAAPHFERKTRQWDDFYNNLTEYNMHQHNGTSQNNYANIRLDMILTDEFGSVSGIVTDGTNPIEGALVEMVGTNQRRITDADGAYVFNYLLAGDYTFKASKFGYEENSESTTVDIKEDVTLNIAITAYPKFTVSGKVVGSLDLTALQNVTITLTGYDDFSTTTNATGDFSIPEVFGTHTYTIRAELVDYISYEAVIPVNEDVVHNITLQRFSYPATNITARLEGDNVIVDWKAPDGSLPAIFRYDSGINVGQVGWSSNPGAGTPNSLLGAVHNRKADLTSMTWYSTSETSQYLYDLWVLGLTPDGMPDRNNVIFTAKSVANIPNQWCTYEFSTPVTTPDNGFFLAVSPSRGGFTSIGTAAATQEYPFVPNKNLGSYGPGLPFECLSVYNFYSNIMIRAEGFSPFSKEVIHFGYAAPEEKSVDGLTNYKLYRLLDEEQDDESNWTEFDGIALQTTYTDTNFNNLSPGLYRYAVKAQYSDGISLPSFSNGMPKDMEISFKVNVTTNSGDNAEGATVRLLNASFVHFAEVDETGTATFDLIWRGTYEITITLAGFKTFVQTIVINPEGTEETYNAQLTEDVVTPHTLMIQETGKPGERLFRWNRGIPFSYILDDGSAEDGLVLDPPQGDPYSFYIGNLFDVNDEGWITHIDMYALWNPLADIWPKGISLAIIDADRNIVHETPHFWFTPDAWNRYVYEDSIPFSGPFYAMLHWDTNQGYPHALGYDSNGPNSDAEYNWAWWIGTGQWALTHNAWTFPPSVFMIRAHGTSIRESKSTNFNNSAKNVTGTLFSGEDIQNAVKTIGLTEPVDTEAKYAELPNISHSKDSRAFMGYTVYLNEVEISTVNENEFLFEELTQGNYTAGVSASFTTGTSPVVTIDFEVSELGAINIVNISETQLFPNPFTNQIFVSTKQIGANIQIYNAFGQKVKDVVYDGKPINTQTLNSGVYFVVIEYNKEKLVHKMVKK